MTLTIKEISAKRDIRKFVKFPDKLYSGNKFYVPAIHSKEFKTLFFDSNPAFEFCKAKYWLAIRDNKIVGRIAGIINNKFNEKNDVKYARFGWLDFIQDEEVLKLLLNAVEGWAKKESIDKIHGPLGFSTFDSSGILIEGFDELPTSFAHYNFPYYPRLIEKFGYEKDVDWVEFNIKIPGKVPEKFSKGSALIQKRYKLHSAVLKNKKDILKYSNDLFTLLNETYKDIYAFTELSKGQIDELIKQFISILRLEYVSIILNQDNKLVAFGITMPSLSRAQQKAKGKLFSLGFIHIMNALRKNDTVDTLLIAVQKEYQNKGVSGLIFNDIAKAFIKNGVTNIESTRELEHNTKVNNLWNKLDYRQHKRARCYIKKL